LEVPLNETQGLERPYSRNNGPFLALFFYAQEYFVKHYLIPVSFAVLGALWMLRTYDAYKSGNTSKLRLYGARC